MIPGGRISNGLCPLKLCQATLKTSENGISSLRTLPMKELSRGRIEGNKTSLLDVVLAIDEDDIERLTLCEKAPEVDELSAVLNVP